MTQPRQKRIAAHDIIPPLDLVIFGGTGDLAARKLLPALLIRFQTGELGSLFRIVCLGQRTLDRESFHQFLTEKVADHLAPSAASAWPNFLSCIHYVCLDAAVANDYAALKAALRHDDSVVRIFYLSTPALSPGVPGERGKF